MANLEMTYLNFDNTIQKCVDYFELDGRVYKDYLLHLYIMRVVFVFKHRYLSVNDYVDYYANEIDKKTVLSDTVKHLKEIKFQFNYYFNAIWC